MKELVFLLEEESAKSMLEALLPRVLSPEITPRLITFEGKQDLERRMIMRLRGYINPSAHFIVMRDLDNHNDCKALKASLLDRCKIAGKEMVSLIRIACRELESFYLADLAAVEAGLGVHGLVKYQQKAKYRSPDDIVSPSRELDALTNKQYQKVSGSRMIGQYLDVNNQRSRSFYNLILGIKKTEKKLLEID